MLRREAAGRRFRPPPWQSRLLSPVKEPVPSGRLHQQAKTSVQESFFLGPRMLTRLRPPACGAVPARRAPNIPDVRHVAGDGGGPQSAGLLPASHLPAPATAVTAPPVGPGSTFHGSDLRHPAHAPTAPPTSASCYTLFLADRSEALSARRPGVPENTIPPHHRRRPEQQQQQKPKRIDLFGSGMAMLQLGMKTAVPHLRPSACHAVPARRALDLADVRRVAAGGGGPTSTGPLPAGHRRATPPAVSPSDVGHGPHSRLPGTPWSGRHLMAPNWPVTRLGRHLPSSMIGKQPTNRLLSTNPEPTIKEAGRDEISSAVEDAVERISRTGGNIKKLSLIDLKELLQQGFEEFKVHHSKETLKKIYDEKIRPALVARGLLSPYPIDDNTGMGIKLLKEYKSYVSDAKFLTSLDLMEEVIKMAELHWSWFLDFLSEEGCLIVENWEHSLYPSFGTTFYKRGVTFDGSPLYRGECDASYNKETKTASICIAIWSSTSEILSSIIVKDFQCKNSVEAEAIAMFLLLSEGFKLGLHEYPFEACSDCDQVFGTLWGARHIGVENADILKLLKYMRRHYKYLIPEWQQREKMFWVDGVMRVMKLEEPSHILDLRRLLKKMKSYLSGKPVFKFTQKTESLYNLINKIREESNQSSPSQQLSPLEYHEKCQMEVEEKNKTEILSHIITALRPSRVYIMVKKSHFEARRKILEMYKDCAIDEISDVDENYTIVPINVKHWTISKTAKKDLWIVFDSCIPEVLLQDKQDSVMVFLRTPSEVVDQNKLPELSPLTFVSLHKTPPPPAKKSPHPITRWTQRCGKLLLAIELPKAKDIVLDLKPEGHFHFSAKGDDDMPYKLDLELYDAINLEEMKKLVGPNDIRFILKKADRGQWWPRLLKKKGRPPFFLKLDSKLDIETAASDVQNGKNEVDEDKEVQSEKKTNEDVGGSRVEQSKGGAAKEEKP